MRIDILSLFPHYFIGPFDESIIKQAKNKGLLDIKLTDIRDYSNNRYKKVDDRPYGGGPGMVMMAEPVAQAIRAARTDRSKVIYLSPQGSPLTAAKCRELATCEHLVLLCGHYEGIDERVLKSDVDEEISVGDYVLTNGCLAAIVLIDAVIRFIPDVLGHELAASEDSFEQGILDCPHYTRPEEFEGQQVPEILQSGNHQKIEEWRLEKALAKTKQVRPDLFLKHLLTKQSLPGKSKKELTGRKLVVNGIRKISLQVKDVRKSIAFYRDQIGFKLVNQATDSAVFEIGENIQVFVGQAREELKTQVVFEVAVSNQEELNGLARALRNEPWAHCVGGVEENQALIQRVEFRDPDGYLWCVLINRI